MPECAVTMKRNMHYLLGNPFAGVAMPRNPQRPLGSSRTLTFAQWDHLSSELEAQRLIFMKPSQLM